MTDEKPELVSWPNEGEPRSWLRLCLLRAVEHELIARAYEYSIMGILAEPEYLHGEHTKPEAVRVAMYRDMIDQYRRIAADYRRQAGEERAKRTPIVVDHVAGIPCTVDATD